MNPLQMISSIDGRYNEYARVLVPIFSEAGLLKYRIVVEVEYLIALSEAKTGLRKLSNPEKAALRAIASLSAEDVAIIHAIEATGYKNIRATNHDVKAIEYFIAEKLKRTSLEDVIPWIHFGLTSEDINNIAYALMLAHATRDVMIPHLEKVLSEMVTLAHRHAHLPMLARTHGQPATPTTFGKEFNVYRARLDRQLKQLKSHKILVKLNGATGGYNAHVVSYPKIDWIKFTRRFIEDLNESQKVTLEPNFLTTQIEPHDSYVELFDIFRRINTILIGFNQDIWRYISDGWIVQKPVEGEIGSSTMPHKVNPIRFENSEGNLGLANALFEHFGRKLPISRLQRDLSDSTVERNFGTAFAHCVIAYSYMLKGLAQIEVNKEAVTNALKSHPEVIAEAIQTILRREGVAMPYEKLKELTRGKQVTLEGIRAFIKTLDVSSSVQKELLDLAPETYLGISEQLADF